MMTSAEEKIVRIQSEFVELQRLFRLKRLSATQFRDATFPLYSYPEDGVSATAQRIRGAMERDLSHAHQTTDSFGWHEPYSSTLIDTTTPIVIFERRGLGQVWFGLVFGILFAAFTLVSMVATIVEHGFPGLLMLPLPLGGSVIAFMTYRTIKSHTSTISKTSGLVSRKYRQKESDGYVYGFEINGHSFHVPRRVAENLEEDVPVTVEYNTGFIWIESRVKSITVERAVASSLEPANSSL